MTCFWDSEKNDNLIGFGHIWNWGFRAKYPFSMVATKSDCCILSGTQHFFISKDDKWNEILGDRFIRPEPKDKKVDSEWSRGARLDATIAFA